MKEKRKNTHKFSDIREDIPIREYDHKQNCFRCEDGKLINLYRIIPRDLVNSDVDEIEMDCFKWAKFYKTYGQDIEFISMMFPCNTQTQQEYWKRKLQNNKNPLYYNMIKRKLAELEYREKHAVAKQFFMKLFFSDENEMKESIKLADSILGIVQEGGKRTGMEILEEISPKKKKQVLYKLGNKSSRIF